MYSLDNVDVSLLVKRFVQLYQKNQTEALIWGHKHIHPAIRPKVRPLIREELLRLGYTIRKGDKDD